MNPRIITPLAALSLLLPPATVTAEPPYSDAFDGSNSASVTPTGCNNDKSTRYCWICDESTDYKWKLEPCGFATSGGSTILNGRHSYLLESTDFSYSGIGGPGCGPCGATSSVGIGGLPALDISRIHRSRITSYTRSSFGRNHFLAEYDRKLTLLKNKTKIRYTNMGGYDNKIELDWDGGRPGHQRRRPVPGPQRDHPPP